MAPKKDNKVKESQPNRSDKKPKKFSSKKHAKKHGKSLEGTATELAASTATPSILNPQVIDTELDRLFKATNFPTLKITAIPNSRDTKEDDNKEGGLLHTETAGIAKKSKSSTQPTPQSKSEKSPKKDLKSEGSTEASYEFKLAIQHAKAFAEQLKRQDNLKSNELGKSSQNSRKTSRESQHQRTESDSEDDPTDSHNSSRDIASTAEDDAVSASDEDSLEESGDEKSVEPLIHETLMAKKSSATLSKSKISRHQKIDPNETPEQRNSRTIFVGNVPIDCVQNKSARRDLLEHLLNPLNEEAPLAKRSRIESVRFRGIPLATPIAIEKPKNPHSLRRSQAWQETRAIPERSFDDAAGGSAGRRGAKPLTPNETAEPPVKFLTSDQKRKIGFVTGNLHPEAKSCIAYVVVAQPTKGSEDSTNLDAEGLAKVMASKGDGTSFMNHTLRCDLASNSKPKKSTNGTGLIDLEEQRRTLFIGGIDFLEEDDSIRRAVESRLLEEKGQPPDGATSWVARVRVVRDKATSLSKGFAYVLLKTQDAVEEMLALPQGSFKIGTKKVRLQKCLSSGQASAIKRTRDSMSNGDKNKKLKSNHQRDSNSTKIIKMSAKPKIDLTQEIVKPTYTGPDQSKELMNLNKLERKKVKSNNQLRVERRMLKKQFKLKLKLLNHQNPNQKMVDSLKKPMKNKSSNKSSNASLHSKSKSKTNAKSKPKPGPRLKSKLLKPNGSKS